MGERYFGGHPVPKTYVPFEPVFKDKFRYQTITFMKVRDENDVIILKSFVTTFLTNRTNFVRVRELPTIL